MRYNAADGVCGGTVDSVEVFVDGAGGDLVTAGTQADFASGGPGNDLLKGNVEAEGLSAISEKTR